MEMRNVVLQKLEHFKKIGEFIECSGDIKGMGEFFLALYAFISDFEVFPVGGMVVETISSLLRRHSYERRKVLIEGENRQDVIKMLDRIAKDWYLPVREMLHRKIGIEFDRYIREEVENPIVTFIVPVFNVENYVVGTIESIRRQTRCDIEIILIDDGSTDGSLDVLQDYRSFDRRIRVIHQKNSGVASARNAGLHVARGKYICFVDGDDIISSELAETMSFMADLHRLDVVGFDIDLFDDKSHETTQYYWGCCNQRKRLPLDKVISLIELDMLAISGSCCPYLYRREFLIRNKLLFPDIAVGEDFIFILSVFIHLERIMWVSKTFYHYRTGRCGSAMTMARREYNEKNVEMSKSMVLCGELLDFGAKNFVGSAGNTKIVIRRIVHELGWYAEKDICTKKFLDFEWNCKNPFLYRIINDREYSSSDEGKRLLKVLSIEVGK